MENGRFDHRAIAPRRWKPLRLHSTVPQGNGDEADTSSAAFVLVIILLDVPAHPQSAPSSQMSANDLARRVITDELRFQDDHTNWMYRLEKEQCRRQSTDAASDITQSKVSPVSMDTWTGYGGVGDYIKSKGNTLEVLAAGHGIRDGEFDRLPANSIPIAHTHANPGLF